MSIHAQQRAKRVTRKSINRVGVSDVIGDDWRTPNTYCKKFRSLGDFSAVYLLVVFDNIEGCGGTDFDSFKIAYVGMSCRISKRFGSHHAVDIIRESGRYFQVWFKEFPKEKLRDAERGLIQMYDPPLNLIGKRVSLL